MRAILLAVIAAGALAAPATLAAPKKPAPPGAAASPASPAGATPKPAPAPAKNAIPSLHLDVRRSTLPNGLRVVLSVDHTSPTIAVDVMYDVGGRNEEKGHSGFAHLFEHMMFQGSQNVQRGEHFTLVMGHGGQLNANTSSDRTNYFEMLPQSELALALWLEADRMKTLEVDQKNLDNQRSVVEEEYRMRYLNAAYVPAELRLMELVFQGYWAYEHPTIGSMPDLEAARLDWVRAFHDAYYAPNNAVLAISGDFDPDRTTELITRYFGDAKAQPSVPKYEPGSLADQTAPRDAVVDDAHARLPMVLDGWAIPPERDPDHYGLELAALVLADGESSRLYRKLVRDKSIAVAADAGTNDQRGPDLFEVSVKLSDKGTVAGVDKMIDDELADLARTGPTDAEMTKARNRLSQKILFGLQSNYARAERLAAYELFWGDANLINTELDRYLAVTKEDVKRVVAKYLTKARRSHVEARPAAEAKNGAVK
jgi:predicted Zn-dependent peptidase